MLSIKVLGPGCANCTKVADIAHQVVNMLAVEATITKVTDRAAWKSYGLLSTPGLVVNEKLVCGGRIPTETEVTTWITNELIAAG
ncbi:MAG: thioredoxin family protein [Anaerolineae bacterium]